jgi:hypothetical protein
MFALMGAIGKGVKIRFSGAFFYSSYFLFLLGCLLTFKSGVEMLT